MTQKYVNIFYVLPISVNERVPQSVLFSSFNPSDVNTITSMRRFDLSNTSDSGVDITSLATITQNIATVNDIWLNTEQPLSGSYRVRLVCSNPSSSVLIEVNLIYTVY